MKKNECTHQYYIYNIRIRKLTLNIDVNMHAFPSTCMHFPTSFKPSILTPSFVLACNTLLLSTKNKRDIIT